MKLYEARAAIASALEGDDHAFWTGMVVEDRNLFAVPLAFEEKSLQQVVDEFLTWRKGCDENTGE